MITIKQQFFDRSLLNNISRFAKESLARPIWASNLAWDSNIVKGAGQVSILRLDDFNDEIKKTYVDSFPRYKGFEFTSMFYVWLRGSHIPWHTDGKYQMGSTVYLNETWNPDDGGIYLWKDEESKIHGEVPEYNKMVLNSGKTPHAVTMISNQAENLRTTVQVFAI